MKICVIGTRGFPNIQGGVEKHCELLYSHIAKISTENTIIVFRRKAYINSKNKTLNKRITFIDLPSTKIKGIEAVIHSFLATIYSLFLKPEIVHIHNIGPSLFAPILKIRNIKIVLTYHSANYEHNKWGYLAKALLRISEKIAFACADHIIFVNKAQMEKCKKHIKHKCYCIPNGVVKPIKTNQKNILERFELAEKEYILSVGRITPEKGFDILIKAYKASKTRFKLVIVGDVETEQEYKNELLKLAQDSSIVFTGTMLNNDLAQLYQNAGFYVLPSRNEGFPIVLLEAMSYGLDLIVSDIPATRQLSLDEDSYYPTNSINKLTALIEAKSLACKRKVYDLKLFDWQNIAKQIYQIYNK